MSSDNTTHQGAQVNAWLENDTGLLTAGVQQKIIVGITPPADCNWDVLDLLVTLNGEGATVLPSSKGIQLRKGGQTVEFAYEVTAASAGGLKLALSLFLQRELTLLEEYSITLTVVER